MILSCIDPRFQPVVYNYLKKKKLVGKYSSFTIAGSAVGVTASKFKRWHKAFWDNFDTSVKLHNIRKLIVINHRDCGAAKIINGKKEFSKANETLVHKNSFQKIKKIFKRKYPKLRMRRLRKEDWSRRLVRENTLSGSDFVLPIFLSLIHI